MPPPLTIGVTTRHGDPAWIAQNSRHYLARLDEFGAHALLLAPDAPATLPSGRVVEPDAEGRLPAALLDALLDELDGLILSGGGDVDPAHFGQARAGVEEESIDPKRDALELDLARAALARDLPLFAICRGCQLLNVAAGGAMLQHLDGHRAPTDAPWLHAVTLRPQSRLAALVGAPTLQVNTYHHQTVDLATLAPPFTPAALDAADPSLVEAFESGAHRWVVGVQWHPERSFELPAAHRRLWQSFLAACRAQQMLVIGDW